MAVSWMEEVACGLALIALHYQSYLSLIEGFFFSISLLRSVWASLLLLTPASSHYCYLLHTFSSRLWSGLFISMQTLFLFNSEDKVFLECGVSKSTLLNITLRGRSYRCYVLCSVTVVCIGGWIIGLVYFGQVQVKQPWKALRGDYPTAKNRPFHPIHIQHNAPD